MGAFIVALYDPPGNAIGEFEQNVDLRQSDEDLRGDGESEDTMSHEQKGKTTNELDNWTSLYPKMQMSLQLHNIGYNEDHLNRIHPLFYLRLSRRRSRSHRFS